MTDARRLDVSAQGGPTPAQTREIIQNLVDALGEIGMTASRGGPATVGSARAIANEALRAMPRRYLPDDPADDKGG